MEKRFKINLRKYLNKLTAMVIGIIFVLFLFLYMIYGGLFASAKVVEGMSAQYIMVYQSMKGSYSKSSEISNKICKWLKSNDIEVEDSFSYYFDNVMDEDVEEHRYIAGCTMTKKDYERLDFVMSNYNVEIFFPIQVISVTIPERNRFSTILGLVKAYPKLYQYQDKKNYPKNAILKITNLNKKQTTYIMSIDPDYNALDRFY